MRPHVRRTAVGSAGGALAEAATATDGNRRPPAAVNEVRTTLAERRHGGGVITIRLHGNPEDTKRKLNRTENLRPIPPGDPDFEKVFGLRSDAESINRGLEDTLYLRRAHSVGRASQHVNLIGWALMVNSLTLAEHRARPPDQLAA